MPRGVEVRVLSPAPKEKLLRNEKLLSFIAVIFTIVLGLSDFEIPYFAGIFAIAFSAIAVMLNDGFTPGFADIIAPSITIRFS